VEKGRARLGITRHGEEVQGAVSKFRGR